MVTQPAKLHSTQQLLKNVGQFRLLCVITKTVVEM